MEEKRGARELNGEGFGMRRVVILVILYSRLAESQKEKKTTERQLNCIHEATDG